MFLHPARQGISLPRLRFPPPAPFHPWVSPPLKSASFTGDTFGRTSPTGLFSNIWESHPLTRLSGEGRAGVGHRRRSRQDTTAPSVRTLCRSASRNPPPSGHLSAHNLPVPPIPPLRRSREAESGGCGGNYFPRRGAGRSPACLSCLFCLFCLFCLSSPAGMG